MEWMKLKRSGDLPVLPAMKRSILLFPALAAVSLALQAAVPPAPKLFPNDTLAVLTVPDWSQTASEMGASSAGRLWKDPAMKPFRDHFEKKFNEKVLGTLEKDMGIRAGDFLALLQGQFSLAVIQNDWRGQEGSQPSFAAVIDTRDKSGQLATQLTEMQKKLRDAKQAVKVEKVRDIEFASVVINLPTEEEDEDAAEPADKDSLKPKGDAGNKMTLYFGQVDTALVVSDSTKTLEKLVARMTGGTIPSLSEEAEFQSSESAWFQKAFAYGWVHTVPLYKVASQTLAESEGADAMGVDPKAALKAAGLEGLKSISMAWNLTSDGSGGTVSLSLPESQRVGLFRMLAAAAKDSSPSAYIPSDAVKFQRWRLDGQKLWGTLEETLAGVSPQLSGFLQLMVGQIGKDKDPSFDLKKNLIGNLGDDVVMYSKAPKGETVEELANPPSMVLVGSPNGLPLMTAMKSAMSAMGGGGEEVKDREFNGKKVVGVRTPSPTGAGDSKLEMATSAGYVAMSSTPAVLEEFLRSSEGGGRSLKDDSAIGVAAQKVGGMSTGLFGYENQRETMRGQWQFLKSGGLTDMISSAGEGEWADLFDFKVLPPYEQVAKYFGIAVYAGETDGRGMHFRFYGPDPK
jgi:hypothetical protein